MPESNYSKYRGKCKEMCEALLKEDPTLILVRGHYFCAAWASNQQHWWLKKQDGTIVDPTRLQFPCEGRGQYTEFDGYITCETCEKQVKEEDAYIDGRHTFCTYKCYGTMCL